MSRGLLPNHSRRRAAPGHPSQRQPAPNLQDRLSRQPGLANRLPGQDSRRRLANRPLDQASRLSRGSDRRRQRQAGRSPVLDRRQPAARRRPRAARPSRGRDQRRRLALNRPTTRVKRRDRPDRAHGRPLPPVPPASDRLSRGHRRRKDGPRLAPAAIHLTMPGPTRPRGRRGRRVHLGLRRLPARRLKSKCLLPSQCATWPT